MQWICNIAIFMVISGILLELIAETKYYKFARWVAGVLLLLQFIQPIAETEEIKEKLAAMFHSFDYALGTDKILEELYEVDSQTADSVLEKYKETISEQIDRILQKNGLGLQRAELSVESNGTLTQMVVWANYLDGMEKSDSLIPTVVPVQIGREESRETVSPLELYIRETLAEFYQLDENKIEVVIQEAE